MEMYNWDEKVHGFSSPSCQNRLSRTTGREKERERETGNGREVGKERGPKKK